MNLAELRFHLASDHLDVAVSKIALAKDWDELQALHAEAHRAHAAAQLAAGREEA